MESSGYALIDFFIIIPAIVLVCGLGHPIALILTGGELREFSIGSGDVLFGFGKIKIRKSLMSGTRCLVDFYDVDKKFSNIFFSLCGSLIMFIISGSIILLIKMKIITYSYPWNFILEVSILAALINLIPYSYNGYNSDGKQIFHILKYGCSSYDAKYNKHMNELRILLEAEKLKRKGKFDEALDKLYVIFQYNPDFIDAKYSMAYIYSSMRDYDKAIEIYNSLFEKETNHITLLCNISAAYRRKGDYEKCYQYIKQAYDIDSKDKTILNNLADYYCLTNNPKKALSIIEQALAIEKKDGYLFSTASEAYFRLGEMDNFYDNFEKALKCGHDMSYIYEDSLFAGLRNDERIQNLFRRYGKASRSCNA